MAEVPAVAPSSPLVVSREPRLPPPERYNGRPEGCQEFFTECSLVFNLQPSSFTTEQARVVYIITLLIGQALIWATVEWQKQTQTCSNSLQFTQELWKV